jgi:uncharacterized repeat protein (TIGR01451 family)
MSTSITVDDGKTSAVPGTSTTYTIVVSNSGPAAVTGASVSDALPAGVTAANWTSSTTGGGSVTGPASGSGALTTTVDLPANATVTFSFTATIDPSATGSLVNAATVSAPGETPFTVVDTDTLTPQADLSVTMTDVVAPVVPGNGDTYLITVTNNGPSTLSTFTLTDPLPAALSNPAFAPSVGSYNLTTGEWNVGSLASGASVTMTLSVTVDPSATGTLSNTVTVAPPAGVTDTNAANNSATDTSTLAPQADLQVTVTDGVTTAVPGASDTYTITVINNGPSTVSSFTLTDPLPVGASSASFGSPSQGSYNPVSGLWSGLSLASGQNVSITFTATISPSATGTITNTATVAPSAGVTDANPGNNSASDTDTLTPQADLAITKTDGVLAAVPGAPDTYTITVSNSGLSAVTGASVFDALPAGVTGATWTQTGSTGGGSVSGPTSGVGALAAIVNLPVNATVTFSFTPTIDASATGSLANTATVTPPAGTTDPSPGNNSFTDTDNLTPRADLSTTNSDGVTNFVPGGSTTYNIVVSNAGPSTAVNSTVTDLFSSAIAAVNWTAVVTPGSSVGSTSGLGNIFTPVTLLPGGMAIFTAVAQISPSATGPLVNTATVSPPLGLDTNPGNNGATDIDLLPTGPSALAFPLPTFQLSAFGPSAGGWSSNDTYPRTVADVNGDGKADIVGFSSAGVFESRATGGPGAQFAAPTFELAAFGANAGGWSSNDTYPRALADVNGDTRADIVAFSSAGVFESLADASGHFGTPTLELAAFGANAGGWSSNDTYPRALADVNGDHMADIIGFGQGGVYESLATPGGHFAAPTFELAAFGTMAGGWSSDNTYPRALADVDGDGKADIVGFGADGVYVSLNTGGGHFAMPTFELAAFGTSGGWASQELDPRTLADVNGDGLADIVGFGADAVYVSLATGGGHFASPTAQLSAFGSNAGGWNSDNTYPRQLADINGNGSADIVGFAANGVITSPH